MIFVETGDKSIKCKGISPIFANLDKLDKIGFKIGLFWIPPNPWYYWIFQLNTIFSP